MPQPRVTPPGLHSKLAVQSLFDEHAPDASEPESTGQVMFDCDTLQLPPLHVAVVAHP
jgi:hypothetical protein